MWWLEEQFRNVNTKQSLKAKRTMERKNTLIYSTTPPWYALIKGKMVTPFYGLAGLSYGPSLRAG